MLVPIDVRVLDNRGEPVKDLTRADFKVYENDVEQEVAHFEAVSFGSAVDRPSEVRNPLAVPTYRTFLIVLGRGQLNRPARGVDALIEFVRDRLLPTDHVGLMAYLRASTPSPDHASALRFLQAFRDRHEQLESRLRRERLGLSDDTVAVIDRLFAAPGLPRFEQLPGASGSNTYRYTNYTYLRWALEYARPLPGEKHLIVVAQDPLGLARLSEAGLENPLVKWATRARVAVWYVQTGGFAGDRMLQGRLVTPRSAYDPLTRDGPLHAPGDHRLFTSLTGGDASFYQYASKPLEAIDRASRFQYLLGYYPLVEEASAAPRRLRIVVTRPGVSVSYRRTFQNETGPKDLESFHEMVARERLDEVIDSLKSGPRILFNGQSISRSRGIRILTATSGGSSSEVGVKVTLAIDPDYMVFAHREGEYHARIYADVRVERANGESLGGLLRRLNLTIPDREFARTTREWIAVDLEFAVPEVPRRLYAAIYNYDSDRAAAASETIRPRR